MSLRSSSQMASWLQQTFRNNPIVVSSAGVAVLASIPAASTVAMSGAIPLTVLKAANLLAFGINVAAVSQPGRIDQQQQDRMVKEGNINPTFAPGENNKAEGDKKTEQSKLLKDSSSSTTFDDIYSSSRGRTLVAPAGWAFAIWGPIYLGEFALVLGQGFSDTYDPILPAFTVPFVAANLCQSLWCAAFRPSYNAGWKKYVSVAMLGSTALALSQVHLIATAAATQTDVSFYYYLLPTTLHFGWTTAATLVNLNGSVAMQPDTTDSTVIAVGHASAVVATAIGTAVTILASSPVYGFTVAWALAACADGMNRRQHQQQPQQQQPSQTLAKGLVVQKYLCWTGSALCVSVAALTAAGVL